MEKSLKFAFIFIISVIVVFNVSSAKADPIVAIDPGTSNPLVGEEFEINVIIDGEDIVNMSGWDGRVLFTPEDLSFQGAAAGDFNPEEGMFFCSNLEPGKVVMIDYNMFQNTVTGQGVIAVVTFVPRRSGSTSLEPFNFTFTDPDATSIPVTLGAGVGITINPNPADLDFDDDVDGSDLAVFAEAYQAGTNPIPLLIFARYYGISL